MSNQINSHWDGHGLNESIEIKADEKGPGNASHRYELSIDGRLVAEIQFQKGPRHFEGSTPGVTESALVAVLLDRLESFNSGDYRCRENSFAITKLEEALHWFKHRADDRARRQVLGTYSK